MLAVTITGVTMPAAVLAQAEPAPTSGTWLVLPATASELSSSSDPILEAARTALSDRGHRVLTGGEMPDLGSDPQELPPQLEARLASAVDPAVEDAAFGRRARVLERINPILRSVGQYLDAVGGRPAAARTVTDLALLAARAHLEGHDPHAAQATVERLLTLVPVPEPTPHLHTHEILALLARTRDRLRAGGGDVQLHVRASDPRTCNAYLNGQLVGPTPLSLQLFGGDYSVRIQCGEDLSRIHRVHVETGATTLEIAVALEAVFVARPNPHLRYGDEATLATRARRDANDLASRSEATHVLLLQHRSDGLHLETLEVAEAQPNVLSSVTTEQPVEQPAAPLAALLRHQAPLEPSEAPSDWSWTTPVGVAAIVLGVAVAVGVPVTSAVTTGCAERIEDVCFTSNQLAVGPVVGWTVAGGVVTAGGIALVLIGATSGPEGSSLQGRFGPTGVSLEGTF